MTDIQIFIILVLGLSLYSAAVWATGWHYGVRTFRARNREFILSIHKAQEDWEKFQKQPSGKVWLAGYTAGQTSAMEASEHAASLDR